MSVQNTNKATAVHSIFGSPAWLRRGRTVPKIFLLIAFALVLSIVPISKSISSTKHTAVTPVQELRIRKDIRELEKSPSELKNLRHAFFMLKKKAKSCNDPDARNDYDCWAAYHNNFELYGCRHGIDLFWPWHRYHLVEFEKALRSSDPANPYRVAEVTLPYWDWSQPPSGRFFPKSVEQKELLADEYYPEDCPDTTQPCINPLWVAGRRDAAECQSIKPACIQETLQLQTWREFGGGDRASQMSDFESQAHNFMHSRYIGGPMADPRTASKDPIYWFFHSFIDNVWDQWQLIHEQDPCNVVANVPNPARPLRIGEWPPSTVQFQAVACTKALGYKYAALGGPSISALPSCPAPRAGCQIQNPETSVLLTTSAAAVADFKRASFKLSGITIPSDFSYDASILIHPASLHYRPGDSAFFDRYVATYFVAWKHGKHNTHTTRDPAVPTTMEVELDVTDKVRSLLTTNTIKDLAVTVVFTPSSSKERSKPLVFRRDFSFSSAALVLDIDGSPKVIPLRPRN